MPTLTWIKNEFAYGYSSGSITTWLPDRRRRHEERQIGGSYRRFFREAVQPHLRPDSRVLEIGPGQGSWSSAILGCIPQGQLHTCDFQDVEAWLRPDEYHGRLVCHKVSDNSFATLADGFFDVFFSVGVLCHSNAQHIGEIMTNARSKMKTGAVAVQHYADWHKLDALGWAPMHNIPAQFRDQPDDDIWWPRNDPDTMTRLCEEAGWQVIEPDLGSFARDSVILLRNGG